METEEYMSEPVASCSPPREYFSEPREAHTPALWEREGATRRVEHAGRLLSPESTIAFSTTRDTPKASGATALNDAAEIYLMNPDTSNLRRLIYNTVGDGFANLSPNGKQIVLDRQSNGTCDLKTYKISDLYVMDADGSNQRYLTRGSSATWSPDGKDIAFHGSASYYASGCLNTGCPINTNPGVATNDSAIFVANVDDLLAGTQRPTYITETPTGLIEDDADWLAPSPGALDGRILFTAHPAGAYQSNQTELYVMNPESCDRTQLTNNNIDPRSNNIEERAAAWSPDGTASCTAAGSMAAGTCSRST
jgi:TolB protein